MEECCIKCGKSGQFLDGRCEICKQQRQNEMIEAYRSIGLSEERIAEKIRKNQELEIHKMKALAYKPKFEKTAKYGIVFYYILFAFIVLTLITGDLWLKGNHFLLGIMVVIYFILLGIASTLEHFRIKNDSHNFYKEGVELDKMIEKNFKDSNGNN